jgi:hypothetical protein
MDSISREPTPELPRPEHIDPRVDDVEVVAAPNEMPESQPLPRESLIKANDAVSQAIGTITADDTTLQPTQADNTLATDNPAIADDVDVIEKEWVEKAKQIVAKTRDDPHSQSKEINIFKHDYMKKRYGKEIKLPDERS